jgi:hypothetical protein
MNKSSDRELSCPTVMRSKEATQRITLRASQLVKQETTRRYWSDVLAWARGELDVFPDRSEVEAQTQDDLIVLCRALGPWAAVEPERLWEPSDPWAR